MTSLEPMIVSTKGSHKQLVDGHRTSNDIWNSKAKLDNYNGS